MQKGIKPQHHAERTENLAIEFLPVSAEIAIPLTQHIGIPNQPLIAPKATIKAGQVIARAEGAVTAPVHASVAGTVKEIIKQVQLNGTYAPVCVITTQSDSAEKEWLTPLTNDQIEPTLLLQRIKETGIVGMGGAGFPTHVKLSPPKNCPIEYILINGAECEPYLTADLRIELEYGKQILDGVLLASQVVGAKYIIIGIEDNKPSAIKHLRSLANGSGIKVVGLPAKYPQGAEKNLIQALIGRKVPVGKLPMHVGAVVLNASTCVAIAEGVRLGKPLIERVVTVSGSGVPNPKNLMVRIGTRLGDVLRYCGVDADKLSVAYKVISGGPMMGVAVSDWQAPITKTTSGILVLTAEETKLAPQEACIRCGRCVECCTMNLMPFRLAMYAEHQHVDGLKQYEIGNCCECGGCSYVCPSHRHLVQYLREGKKVVQKK